ncbi:MAG: His/Gly/Thr/Pro-type tRNA ligase C-terminal domain-containing protein [Microgenomates group bacterium]
MAIKEHLVKYGFLWGPEHSPYPVSGFMTYPPNGAAVKRTIESGYQRIFQSEGFDEIATPVFLPEKAWEASGHLERFGNEMFHTKTSEGQSLLGRPELATTIYPMFKKLLEFYRGHLPFRIFQSGISLPNDIQTEWQTRTRQYTAHEGHIFMESPAPVEQTISYLEQLSYTLMETAGLRRDQLIFNEKSAKDKPFYAKQGYGLYAQDESGNPLEILGIQYRSSNDFEQHSKASGIKLMHNGKYPEVFEISFSTERPFLLALTYALKKMGERTVLAIPDHLAPHPGLIFPVRHTPEQMTFAANLYQSLHTIGIHLPLITHGNIGSCYAYADAIGVPYSLTVDSTSPIDNAFTIRHRDTMHQVRISLADIQQTITHVPYTASISEILSKTYEYGKNK